MKKVVFLLAAALMLSTSLLAKSPKVDDKELVGFWIMESMQWEGEKVTECGLKNGYTQIKYYGADGEYACAEIALDKKSGKVVVMPHEYGTYWFRNGQYSEMGREATSDGLVLVDQNTFKGKWKTLHQVWKKQSDMPKEVVDFIMDKCRTLNASDELQRKMKASLFK